MDSTQVTVAIVGASALLGSTTVPSVLGYLQGRTTRAIVRGNGHGDVAQMSETVLHRLDELSGRLTAHERKDLASAARLHDGQELIREGQVALLKEFGLLNDRLRDVPPGGKGQKEG